MSKKVLFVKAVIFDMDGVITNTMPDHYRAWRKVFRDEGIPVTHLDVYCREGQKGIVSVQEIFTKYGRPFTQSKALELLDKKEKIFQEIVRRRFIRGSRRLLKSLRHLEIFLALVTGTARHEMNRILPKSIRDEFSVIVTGSDVRHGKPHPEPYSKALKQLKLKATEAIVIENAPLGIESAKRAGLRCFALETSLPKPFLKKADEIFSSIKELQTHIQFKKK